MKKFLIVNKYDLDKDDFEIALKFHNDSKESLPEGIQSILVPKEWTVTVINEKCIQIGISTDLDLEYSQKMFEMVKEDVNEDMTVLTYLGESEFL